MKNRQLSLTGCFIVIGIILLMLSCKKSNSVELSATLNKADTTISDTTIFIDITLDGTRIFGIENLNTEPNWGQIWPGEPGVTGDSSVYAGGNRIGADFGSYQNQFFYFTKGNCYNVPALINPGQPPEASPLPLASFVDTFFSLGNYNYSILAGDTTVVEPNGSVIKQHLLNGGISIAWTDANGKLWATFNGSADQSGSYFTIVTNNIPNPMSWGNVTTVTANFACKLYDSNGNVMQLTKGRFRQPIYW